jgi:tRNA (guanosine-2'-O-)-methyltransferase
VRYSDKSVFEVSIERALRHDPRKVIEVLEGRLTESRLSRIREIVARRSIDVVPLLENVADPHNASAILRSCDAFGIARAHVVATRNSFLASRKIAKGTERWVDVERHPSSTEAVRALRKDGYALYVASMDGELAPEDLVTPGGRVAVVFGNEHRGVSDELRAVADGSFAIPMKGLVESLNVSVAAAIPLYTLSRAMCTPLTMGERLVLEARLLLAAVHRGAAIVDEVLGAANVAEDHRPL